MNEKGFSLRTSCGYSSSGLVIVIFEHLLDGKPITKYEILLPVPNAEAFARELPDCIANAKAAGSGIIVTPTLK